MEKVDTKPVGAMGRLGIPENLRSLLNMRPGQQVNVFLDGPALVIVSVDAPDYCCICGTTEVPLVPVAGKKKMCSDCLTSVAASYGAALMADKSINL